MRENDSRGDAAAPARVPVRRSRALHVALMVALAAVAALGGCKPDEATVPRGKPEIVVHAVLDPVTFYQVVLVEQTLTGEVKVPDRTAGDSLEPILSGGGIPITDAVVTINGATGIQDADVRPDGKGHGVYRFRNIPPPLLGTPTNEVQIIRGAGYDLTVTWRGQVAHAHTTVPNPDRLQPISFTRSTFNVDHDSLVLDWPRAEAAKRYALIATTPFGPFLLFSDSARLVVRGGLRNLYAESLPFVFVPGFRQTIATEAVDTNYFDYFRSFNNPFTGSGIVNHVDGGIGVFGAIYPLDTLGLDVTADFDESFEGHYVGGPSGSDALDLYLGEDVGNGARRVTGRLSRGVSPNGIVGFTTGDGKLALAVLQGQFANDTLALFPAVAAGDSIVGAIGSEAPSVYRRTSPAPLTASRAARGVVYARPQRARWRGTTP